jgi:hypothetical protein
MAVENGDLVVTDRKGTERRFPLNSGPTSPARYMVISPNAPGAFRIQWAIVDGSDEVLVLGYIGDWDSVETEEIERAAGLSIGSEDRDTPKTELRHDGILLEDGTWWKLAPAAGSVAFVVALITGAGALPAALGWPLVVALMAFLVIGMTSGAYGKHRRGKGAAVDDAILTGDKEAFRTALDEARNPSKSADPDPPEATT